MSLKEGSWHEGVRTTETISDRTGCCHHGHRGYADWQPDLFQDIYSWAGAVRTVDIAKGSMFCLTQHIQSYAQTIFLVYHTDCMRMKGDPERFIHIFTKYYADLNALHPFREGNGRSQKAFAWELCFRCGYEFDLSHTNHEEMLSASISLIEGDKAVFKKCIKPF